MAGLEVDATPASSYASLQIAVICKPYVMAAASPALELGVDASQSGAMSARRELLARCALIARLGTDRILNDINNLQPLIESSESVFSRSLTVPQGVEDTKHWAPVMLLLEAAIGQFGIESLQWTGDYFHTYLTVANQAFPRFIRKISDDPSIVQISIYEAMCSATALCDDNSLWSVSLCAETGICDRQSRIAGGRKLSATDQMTVQRIASHIKRAVADGSWKQ
jgi:hypothetical protein